ncbi:unnamed protein product [Allacma fusca]|uniref:SEC14-like protein 2 n=1 Tax=Allacma fusca TaxID=39272 RepID=A0A8J2KV79_9HEXA|nr:unnamed protein product [Allacma fusca]
MAAFTNKEIEALSKFRSVISDLNLDPEQSSEHHLIRWLRARDLNVQQASEMLRKSLQWRKDNKIDQVSTWEPPASFQQDYPYDVNGFDRDGCPLLLIPWGRWDIRKAVQADQKDEYIRYVDQMVDKAFSIMCLQNKNRPLNNPITQLSIISDLEGYSLRQMTSKGTVDCIMEATRRLEANYPEILKASYTINTPKLFSVLFALVKPLLAQRTLDKVQIHGYNEDKWGPVLLKLVPPDQLPVCYGGTRTPSENFVEIQGKSMAGAEESNGNTHCVVAVKVEENLTVALDIKNPNSVLSWSFRTEESNIGFALYFNGTEPLVTLEIVDSHVTKQEGSYVCVKPGRYIFDFDNTHSKTEKTLHYLVSVSNDDSDDA